MTPPPEAPLLTQDSEDLARDYDRISVDRQFQSGKSLVERLSIAPGEHVLDVGCGTGLLAHHIAGLVRPSGHVLGIDPLPLRIALAQQRARPGLEFRVGDAYRLDVLQAESFDVVCMNAVFHWLPEKAAPLRQIARILKPGGRLGIGSGLKGYRTGIQELVAQVLARPPFSDYPRPPGGYTFRVDEQEMRDLLEAAGLTVSSIEVRETRTHYPSPEAAIRYSEASSFGNFLAHLPDTLRPAARAAIARELATITTPAGIPREGRRLVAIAIRPSA